MSYNSVVNTYNNKTKYYINVNPKKLSLSSLNSSLMFNTTTLINPSSLKLYENIDQEYLNINNITNENNIVQITENDYNNFSGFNIQTELPNGIIIKLPNIQNIDTRIYISFAIINSSNESVTIKSDYTLIYNSIFINPNGSYTYSLPPNKILTANLIKQKNNLIWGLIIS